MCFIKHEYIQVQQVQPQLNLNALFKNFFSTQNFICCHFRDPVELQAGSYKPTDSKVVHHSHFWKESYHLIIT